MWKRKRDEIERSGGGEEEIFKRNKIVERSPVKEIEKSELGEWMREMKEGFERMTERTERAEEVRREFREQGRGTMNEDGGNEKGVQRATEGMEEGEEELRRKIEEMKERIGKLEEGERKEGNLRQSRIGGNKIMDKVSELDRRLDIREKEERRRNVIIGE